MLYKCVRCGNFKKIGSKSTSKNCYKTNSAKNKPIKYTFYLKKQTIL